MQDQQRSDGLCAAMGMTFKAQQGLLAASDSQATEDASEDVRVKSDVDKPRLQNYGKTFFLQKIMLVILDIFWPQKTLFC